MAIVHSADFATRFHYPLIAVTCITDLHSNAFIHISHTDAMLLWCVMGRIWGDVHHATSVWTCDHWNIKRNRILSQLLNHYQNHSLFGFISFRVCSGFCRKCRHGYHAGSQCVTLDDVIAQKTARVKKTMVGFSQDLPTCFIFQSIHECIRDSMH